MVFKDKVLLNLYNILIDNENINIDEEYNEIYFRFHLGDMILKEYLKYNDIDINVDLESFKYILGWFCLDLPKI